jgi:dTDP-3-amino-2,3,6-trideoxy-4-keto-D-glucose/dTDP-3-amino-3,4,6-trideoxy-alpha-D-glucose/dTDP-2,6-dideoxy-D-kanosamine transaminase
VIPVNDLGRRAGGIRERLIDAAAGVIDSGWYSNGPRLNAFEAAFAEYCGVTNCIGVASGTDALELALRACGAQPGKRVITVANAGGYSTTAILATGAEPMFVDIDPATMLVDIQSLSHAVAADTAAIVVTHLYGRMVNMPAVMEVAARCGLPVVEDCAQAHGARMDGKAAGAWGTLGCFSFYPTKNLGAIGDGGAVVTQDPALARSVRELRQYGWTEKYHTTYLGGRNSRLDEIQAAFLFEQLPMLEGWNHRRRQIARQYADGLRDTDLTLPAAGGGEYVAHLYVIAVRERETLRARLRSAGVATDVHYPVPDHWQAAWNGCPWAGVALPATEESASRVLTIPCFPELTDSEVCAVIAALRACVSM